MKNKFFGSKLNTILLTILIILMIIALRWMHAGKQVYLPSNFQDTKSTSEEVKTNKNDQLSNNVDSGVTLQPSEPNDPYKYYITNGDVYKNSELNFQMNLPKGSRISVYKNNEEQKTTFLLSRQNAYLRVLGIGKPSCTGSEVMVNGIAYSRTIEYGNWGGMESGSFDASYCVIHNNTGYTLTFSHSYPRVGPDAVTPNEVQDLKAFETELKLLNFKFTN